MNFGGEQEKIIDFEPFRMIYLDCVGTYLESIEFLTLAQVAAIRIPAGSLSRAGHAYACAAAAAVMPITAYYYYMLNIYKSNDGRRSFAIPDEYFAGTRMQIVSRPK